MTTRVVKEGNVTTTVVDMTNGVGGRSAEVRQVKDKYEINIKLNKLAKLRDAIAISKSETIPDPLTDRGRCQEMLSHLKNTLRTIT